MGPALAAARVAPGGGAIAPRTLGIAAVASAIGLAAALIAEVLTHSLALVTNLAFFHRWSFEDASPAENQLGAWVVLVPVAGALLVGLMARYGSKAIRGHGIPEAMEQVLLRLGHPTCSFHPATSSQERGRAMGSPNVGVVLTSPHVERRLDVISEHAKAGGEVD